MKAVFTLNDKSLATILAPIMADVQANQKPPRQIHIYGVIQASMALAQLHGVNMDKAILAAALHDCAKHISRDEALRLMKDGHIQLSEDDMAYPATWHGPLGAWMARTNYQVSDPEILDAIENHTLGHSSPSPLLQIIMCADTTEPTRDFPGVDELRKAVRNDLRSGLLAVLNTKVSDILAKGQTPHPRIFDTIRSLEN